MCYKAGANMGMHNEALYSRLLMLTIPNSQILSLFEASNVPVFSVQC
jgi:hypothetical protein